MKTAIVYYSLTGHSARVAKLLSEALACDLIEVSAPGYAMGFLGYLRAGFDSLAQRRKLAPQTFTSLAKFDRVVLCGPIWTSYPAPPLRALLTSDIDLPAAVGLVLTHGNHSPPAKAFETARADLGREFVATGALGNADEGTQAENDHIAAFLADFDTVQPLTSAQ